MYGRNKGGLILQDSAVVSLVFNIKIHINLFHFVKYFYFFDKILMKSISGWNILLYYNTDKYRQLLHRGEFIISLFHANVFPIQSMYLGVPNSSFKVIFIQC